MAEEYLTTRAKFKCPLGRMFTAVESVNAKARAKGAPLLTLAGAKLVAGAPINCTFLPPLPNGMPPPCPCQILAPLNPGVRHKASNGNLLTKNAKAICVAGQAVQAIDSGVGGKILYGAV